MLRRWLDDEGEQALRAAVSQIEATSSVELVIAIRRRARVWLHVPFLAATLSAWLTLTVMMFSDPTFALWSFVVDPFVIGALVGWAASAMPWLMRGLTPAALRRRAVVAAANATFVEKRVHDTRSRTGILVYGALAERMAAVVADRGVSAAFQPTTLAQWQAQIEQAMHGGAKTTAAAIAAMSPRFSAALPRLDSDTNELADLVEHDVDWRARL